MQKAVIDRIVDGKHAVLLVGQEELEKVIPSSQLPEGASEGTWIKIDLDGEEIISIQIDHDETNERKERISSKMELLRQRSKRKS